MSEYEFGEQDAYFFREGTHSRLFEHLGAHLAPTDGPSPGCRFAVWAPAARSVSVVGDFNDWDRDAAPLELDEATGIWRSFVPGVPEGALYKYHVVSRIEDYRVDKSDPFAWYREVPPASASITHRLDYDWADQAWMDGRKSANSLDAPWSIYEIHLGSWRRHADGHTLPYAEIAPALVDYVLDMGFTHVELLPVMEHPYYPSWGYQTTGYFAPTSRYGTPQDFMSLVDLLHQAGIGVILDWVPSHFPADAHGLGFFDGTYLYEHADPQKRIHPDWDSLEFNYGRGEVQSYLLSSAQYWLERYHVDGLRVDAVASMLYLDYSRGEGEWSPNRHGGRESLEAISFLRRFNETVYASDSGIHTVAEESTAWPLVSRPTDIGGLGFGMKWDMGFMHDTLDYLSEQPRHRRFHHEKITFRPMYAFTENFVLPFSHDEVVHGKGSLLTRMPGDGDEQFAQLRLLYGYTWAQPGKKLLFMGSEFGQRREWDHDDALEWFVLEHAGHKGVQDWVRELNRLYRSEPALHRLDFDPEGFSWVECRNDGSSVLTALRLAPETRPILLLFNFGPEDRELRVGVPEDGVWTTLLDSADSRFGGPRDETPPDVTAVAGTHQDRPFSLEVSLPAAAAVYMAPVGEREA